ncbi:glutamate--tRNA ligase [Bacilliculturomica massiliensis]|uniref:glutamate--tRNA ligase n=1 Tax=Bacilliculturomica massiliensis TaxID=1917867 RepID=UPI00103018D7|nr:glutamate--tRNA ligase [Bacilliculturomica massiliensis]
MDYNKLANLLFPQIKKTPEDYEAIYPPRDLPEGAKVTRLGPSPTGFIHLGNLYGAFADERLAHQSGGVFYLRIEDTDDKREVQGAVPAVINALHHFGVNFDEGATLTGETGDYGPYYQSQRGEIYQCFAKKLVAMGLAYPCFMTEDEIQAIRDQQEKDKLNPGIYGEYARHRDLSFEEVVERISQGQEYVVRFRSQGDPERHFSVEDGIRGVLSMPENDQDVVILKKTGIPTYHFAHVVDDHLMRTTHVLRGEEWLSSLPIHVALFEALGWEPPVYCHTTVLMKMDGETKRKLSKRKDPELSLEYYKKEGYHPAGVREYLMTILNSNFEEWRIANPEAPIEAFAFSTDKMSNSGTLFDLDKLNDVCKDVLARMTAEEILFYMLNWAREYQPALAELMAANDEKMLRIFSIDRGGEKPRKDLIYCRQIFHFISYFFDDHFIIEGSYPENVSWRDAKEILNRYFQTYDPNDDQDQWFEKVRTITADLGYAVKPKDFKKNPDQYKGHVGHVSNVIRMAITGRTMSPDLWEIQQIMGLEQVRGRIAQAFQDIG